MSQASKNFVPVSVIIACYRCSNTIERTIDSVAAQTFLPQEVICVEDYSNDEDATLNRLIRLQNKYGSEWIKIIRNETNKKAGITRNNGWNIATGKYVAFLDADDTWHPEKLKTQYEIMEKSPDVDLSGSIIRVLRPNKIPSAAAYSIKIKKIIRMEILRHNPFFTSSVMCKRNIALRFSDLTNCQDYQLWLDMFFHSYSMILITPTLTYMHKPPYGVKGLGANIWKTYAALNQLFLMERRRNNIKCWEYIIMKIYWDLKQLRRIVISYYNYIFLSKRFE